MRGQKKEAGRAGPDWIAFGPAGRRGYLRGGEMRGETKKDQIR